VGFIDDQDLLPADPFYLIERCPRMVNEIDPELAALGLLL
jgi:hypothetical protein